MPNQTPPPPPPARTCPACARRWAMLIDAECPICAGTGTLTLGRAAKTETAQAAARTVEYALEAAARQHLTASPHAAAVRTARRALTDTIQQLRTAGILAPTEPTSPHRAGNPGPTPERNTTHWQAVQNTPAYRPGDAATLDAPPLEWALEDRPLETGGLPGFSMAGYLSHLARAADPINPLHTDTNQIRMQRARADHTAGTLTLIAAKQAPQ